MTGKTLIVAARGKARAPDVGRSDDVWALVYSFAGGAAVRLSERAGVVADARVLMMTPRPTVRMLETEVADAGRPSLVVSLGLLSSF